MIVVIQCASSKRVGAGHLQTRACKKVLFVADPASAPISDEVLYARPDDPSDDGSTWREVLLQYNRQPGNNPLGLSRAAELYTHSAYTQLAQKFGIKRTYILSAGWGLIGGSFLTPNYDITFSQSAESYKRRGKGSPYHDLRMLPNTVDEPVVFFGGKDYLRLFCQLTQSIKGPRTVFYNSSMIPDAPNCSLVRFQTTTRTNWHYECVRAFLDGKIAI